jgi:hypothetical protein
VTGDGVTYDGPFSGDDVEDPRREDLSCQLGEIKRGQRCDLRRLYDRGVARREGRADLPDGHHQGVVPRADAGDNPEGLPADHRGEAPLVLTSRLTLLATGRPGKKAQVVRDEGNVALGQGDGLSHVDRLEAGKLVRVGVKGVGQLQQHAGTLFGRGVEPDLVVGLLRRGHGPVDVFFVGHGDLGDRLAGGRVEVVLGLAFYGIDPLPTDEQRAVLLQVH